MKDQMSDQTQPKFNTEDSPHSENFQSNLAFWLGVNKTDTKGGGWFQMKD